MEKIIEFKNVYKTYKLYKNENMRLIGMISKKVRYSKKNVINNVSFNINRGESVALFGKNGAGKSTILKMITEVIFPTKGEINVKGRVSALLELTVGFDIELTGRENIYLKGSIMGIEKSAMKEMEKQIIEFAELEEYIDQPVRMYSSGMKARLGFSICVNIEPEILIVDEALSVGDKKFQNKCLEKVQALMSRENITLLFVTHSLGTAEKFCKRGIVLKNGKIFFDGNIKDAIKEYDKI